MIYVPTKYLTDKMELARDIYIDSSYIPFLSANQRLTNNYIKKIDEMRLPGVYIKSKFAGDIEVEEIIDPELKRKLIKDIKAIFDSSSVEKSFTIANSKQVYGMACNIVNNILSKDEVVFNVIEIKNHSDYLITHSMYLAVLSAIIGINMGFNSNELTDLTTAALLQDLGMVSLPKELLEKETPLTDSEIEKIKQHPVTTSRKLRPCCSLNSQIISAVASHHERFDGTGYPYGLCGEEIPLYGRILAMADVYDALTTPKPYRRAYTPSEAIEYMMGQAGKQFDGELLEIFLKCVTPYSIGTIVKLSNGQYGIVVKNTSYFPLRPVIRILIDGDRVEEVDLATDEKYMSITILDKADDMDISSFI